MAFFSKARSIIQHTVTKHINHEISASRPSIFQAIRCMSQSKLFIGGISYQSDESSLREAFSKYGDVVEARIITDRDTGRSRGFGFITFSTTEEASAAIQALDGQELHGRRIRVNYANDRSRGFGGGGGGGYGGQGGYGGYGGGGGYGGQGGYGGNYNSGSSSYGGGGSGGYNTTGGDSYGSGGASYGSSGNYTSGNSYDSGSLNYGGGSSQNYGVAGGGGGSSDNYTAASNFASSGFSGNQGSGYGNGNLDSSEGGNIGGADDGYNPGETSFQDNNEPPEDCVDKRA